MKRVEHIGEVIAIEEDKAVVQLRPSEDCKPGFGCACCASVRPEARRLRVQREDLEEGDVVSVSVPAYLGYVSTLTAFGLPGLTFLIGALIGAAIEGNQEAHGMPIIVGGHTWPVHRFRPGGVGGAQVRRLDGVPGPPCGGGRGLSGPAQMPCAPPWRAGFSIARTIRSTASSSVNPRAISVSICRESTLPIAASCVTRASG